MTTATTHFGDDATHDIGECDGLTAVPDTFGPRRNPVVAFDHDGARYCPDCAADHDKIDRERYHNRPWSVPAGGSVTHDQMAETDHTYHCTRCHAEIPSP